MNFKNGFINILNESSINDLLVSKADFNTFRS